jgi:hypothetical protein
MGPIRVLLLSLSAAFVANASLIHHYTFNGNVDDQVLIDSENGTLLGDATAIGGVLSLDGSGDYVQFGAHLVPFGTNTVALLVRSFGPQATITELISQGASGGPGYYIGTDGGAGFRLTDQWGAPGIAFPAADGEWHRVALVYDGEYRVYVDGDLKGASGSKLAAGNGGSDTRFGRQFSPYDEYFNGDLADVRIYNTALGASEVAALSNQLAAVPEPSSMLLIGAGTVLLALRRRR